ncbi:MAG: pilus assembly protein N-terminal domain-containing protein [Aestuariivirga sp.]
MDSIPVRRPGLLLVQTGDYFTRDINKFRVSQFRNRRFTIHVHIGKPLQGNRWTAIKETRDMLKLVRITSTALALAFLHTSASLATQQLVVKTDQTQLISVSGNPGTVVIGNPSIADVTVHGNKLFVHGRAYGTTNLIILDENGNQLSNLDITVMLGGENNLQIYKAGARYSYVCAPGCEGTLQSGDATGFFGDISKMDAKKSGTAQGKASTEQEAAPAAQ